LLKPDPNILSALYSEKQSIYSSIDKYQEALYCYQKAYEYNPKPEYVFYIASLYQNKLNNLDSALTNYERFLYLLPQKVLADTNNTRKDQMTITLRSVAESNIVKIKEDLFFNGNLK
jgi:tetratricopeptide (TPR) repeat protein